MRRNAIWFDQTVFPRNRIPLLPVIRLLDQRIGQIAQRAFVISQFEGRRRGRLAGNGIAARASRGYRRAPDWDALRRNRRWRSRRAVPAPRARKRAGARWAPASAAAAALASDGSGPARFNGRCGDGGGGRNYCRYPVPTPSGSRSMRITGRMITVAGSVLASTYLPARVLPDLVGKPDDFAHGNPLFRPGGPLLRTIFSEKPIPLVRDHAPTRRIGALQLNGLQG